MLADLSAGGWCRGRRGLEPFLHRQTRYVMEVPHVARHQDKVLALRRRCDQPVRVGQGSSLPLPLRSEVGRSNGQSFIKRQDGEAGKHLRLRPLPKFVSRRADLCPVADFLDANDGGEQGLWLDLKTGFHPWIGSQADQLAKNIGVEQIHASVELGRRTGGHSVAILLDLLQDLENRVVIRDAIGVVVGAIRKASQFPPQGAAEILRMSGQLGADRPLVLRGQAFDQLNNMQCGRAHSKNLPLPPENRKSQAIADFQFPIPQMHF